MIWGSVSLWVLAGWCLAWRGEAVWGSCLVGWVLLGCGCLDWVSR